jgi:ribonuclease-3
VSGKRGGDAGGAPGRPARARLEGAEDALGHVFEDRELLARALTHRSYTNEVPGAAGTDNEALEFLGDAVLGFVVADRLFRRLPGLDEHRLTKHLSLLVKTPTLAEAARHLGLPEHLLLGRGARLTGAAQGERVLAGSFEAMLAAIYLDGGLRPARRFVVRSLRPWLERLDADNPVTDWKSALQEVAQAGGLPVPQYRVLEEQGAAHEKRFRVAVTVGDRDLGEGEGSSKRRAHQEAARRALGRLRRAEAGGDDEARVSPDRGRPSARR